MIRRQPELKDVPFALVTREKGRRIVKSVNKVAQKKGLNTGMVVADCRALVPELELFEFNEIELNELLQSLAEWSVRYTPSVSIDADGLVLDVSGCTHLWGSEQEYLKEIFTRFKALGYHTQLGMADTIGCAWAICRFGTNGSIISENKQYDAIKLLPPEALRIEQTICEKLDKLGLKTIGSFACMPRTALRRRFGQGLLTRLDQALGTEIEWLIPIKPLDPFEERLPSLEPILTASGIEIALRKLLEKLCERMMKESKGIRKCEFICYRIDGNIQKIEIGTSRPTRNVNHLFKLLALKIPTIEPDLGIELFVIKATMVEELLNSQDALWSVSFAHEAAVAELIDKIAGKIGSHAIHRYLPAQHYWPERSVKETFSLTEKADTEWKMDLPRPLHLLRKPQVIEVSVRMPDYPPLLFLYNGVRHIVKKADGPERIEQEWWLQNGQYRDYYCVEDEKGLRYWLFRLGDYNNTNPLWFIHGFFA